ncbi:MAG TPA: DNA repair protein RecN [Nocardioidaceae bacterium]|nr:DNA repair protein RecN [Nocardioidaceae bacterium]
MWEQIRLASIGVIDEAELELGPGFMVITGETGAGKTMVVTGLDLLCGGRADPGLVRRGEARSRIEARVLVDGSSERIDQVAEQVAEAGGEIDDQTLIISRAVSSEGRSRAHLGGVAVPAGVLARISDLLVTVHGQSDQHRLLRPVAQRQAVDRFGGASVAGALERYRPAYARWREVGAELQDLRDQADERQHELERLQFGLDEIGAVDPKPGEDDELRAEEQRLAHADGLVTASAEAHADLAGSDGTDATDGSDATSLMAAASRRLEAQREHDARVAELADRVAELSYLLADLATDLAGYSTSVDSDPARLSWVQERRAALTALTRKYGSTVNDVLAWSKDAAARLADLEGADDRIDRLQAERDELVETVGATAAELTAARSEAAQRLGERVTTEVAALAMPQAEVTIEVHARADASTPDGLEHLGPDGGDDVEFRLAANPGAQARPLAKAASGGELSRVMLALEVVLAGTADIPTFVFDEVDAGIGGSAAVEVGKRLARLARSAQVIAVTHLPQVAAFADRHYRVLKADDGSVTTSGVQQLDESARVRELSRMLAGLEGSETAEAHARELLDLAATERADATDG